MISEAAVLARYSHWPAEARPRTRAPSPSVNRLRRATSATAVEPAICAVFLNKRKASLPAFMRAGCSIYFRWSSLAFANLLRVPRVILELMVGIWSRFRFYVPTDMVVCHVSMLSYMCARKVGFSLLHVDNCRRSEQISQTLPASLCRRHRLYIAAGVRFRICRMRKSGVDPCVVSRSITP